MTGKMHVLIIEDSADDALLMLREMRRGECDAEIQRIETTEEMRRALVEREWDAIISDHRMPHFSSTEALALLQEFDMDIPFIIVSGAIGEDAAVAAMKAGACDYVQKDNMRRLVPIIERETSNAEDRRAQRVKERRLRDRQELITTILKILNSDYETLHIINEILVKVKDFSDMEAVSIRLRQGENYPHIAHYGFTEEFIQEEWSLCARNDAGELLRDETGGIVFECMCGVVVSGRTDPAIPVFSAHGSFWTNMASEYLKQAGDANIEIVNPRNKCINEGYESIALVPLRSGNDTIGLLQLNDRRTGRFTQDLIEFFEEVGMTIGIALKRRMIEDEIREKEQRFRKLHESMIDAFVQVDMRGFIVSCNAAYRDMLGYPDMELQRMNYVDLTPEKWHAIEADIVRDQILKHGYSEIYEKEYRRKDGSVFPVELRVVLLTDESGKPNGMWAIVRDITGRKLMEDEIQHQLKELKRWHAVMLDREDRVLELKKEVNNLLKEAGKPARYGGL